MIGEAELMRLAQEIANLKSEVADLRRRERAAVYDSAKVGAAIASVLAVPKLRGFWPFSGLTAGGAALDMASNLLHLTSNGGITSRLQHPPGMPYTEFNGTTQYWSRADGPDIEVSAHLTVGGWFKVNSLTPHQTFMAKLGAGGQYSWLLEKPPGAYPTFLISGNGTAYTQIIGTSPMVAGKWHFVWGRYYPNLLMNVNVDLTADGTTASVPSGIFNSTSAFTIGARATGNQPLAGQSALCWLSADGVAGALLNEMYRAQAPLFDW
jgi:hypothetical protein